MQFFRVMLQIFTLSAHNIKQDMKGVGNKNLQPFFYYRNRDLYLSQNALAFSTLDQWHPPCTLQDEKKMFQ